MGAEPGRRFLKQPAAKLEPVIVAFEIFTKIPKIRRPPTRAKNAPLSWPVFKIAMCIIFTLLIRFR